jgi:tRNA(fMet)-specific endonuclease VapC
MHLLDTSLCRHIIEKAPPKALGRLLECPPDAVGISVVTLGELAHGVAASRAPDKQRKALELFLAALQVVEYSVQAALTYGELRAQLEEKGVEMGVAEAMVAAHALSLGATLATRSPKSLRRISGLSVENWAR